MNQNKDQAKKKGKIIFGIVVSDKMKDTIVVNVETLKKDPRVKKIVKVSKRYYADDPKNECSEGDKVQIIHARPLSKLKRYRLHKVVEKVK